MLSPAPGLFFTSLSSQICTVITTAFWQVAVKEKARLFLIHREALSGLTEARGEVTLETHCAFASKIVLPPEANRIS